MTAPPFRLLASPHGRRRGCAASSVRTRSFSSFTRNCGCHARYARSAHASDRAALNAHSSALNAIRDTPPLSALRQHAVVEIASSRSRLS